MQADIQDLKRARDDVSFFWPVSLIVGGTVAAVLGLTAVQCSDVNCTNAWVIFGAGGAAMVGGTALVITKARTKGMLEQTIEERERQLRTTGASTSFKSDADRSWRIITGSRTTVGFYIPVSYTF